MHHDQHNAPGLRYMYSTGLSVLKLRFSFSCSFCFTCIIRLERLLKWMVGSRIDPRRAVACMRRLFPICFYFALFLLWESETSSDSQWVIVTLCFRGQPILFLPIGDPTGGGATRWSLPRCIGLRRLDNSRSAYRCI
jgi:hypothetical protein